MKSSKLTLVTLTMAIVLFGAMPTLAQHYYGNGQAINLGVDSGKVLIRMDSSYSVPFNESLEQIIGRISAEIEDSSAVDDFDVYALTSGSNYYSFLDSLDSVPGIDLVEPYYYLDTTDAAMYIGSRFCVRFSEEINQSTIDSLNDANNVTLIKPLEFMDDVYVLSNTKASGQRLLDLANVYYNLEMTEYSHPVWGMRSVLFGYKVYDYYAANQPHITKVIGELNVASVWDFAGLTDSIVVAVIDDGMASHEDLPASRITEGISYHHGDSTDVTPLVISAHGMGVAGIIGATHTTDSVEGQNPNSGVISMMPHAKIMPAQIYYITWPADEPTKAAFIAWAYQNGAQVINNSWGYPVPGFYSDVIADALDRAFAFGRGGKGCVIVGATGNEATDYPGHVSFPANHQYSLGVGATELDDDRWYYSQYGTGLDLVAPSGDKSFQGDVWTIDQMDSLGYNPYYGLECPSEAENDWDYMCAFGGTSAAAPIVSGTAALLLSFDSTLSAAAVYYILENSAVTELESGTITPPDTAYGYGRVDAFRAILSLARGDMNADGVINLADITYLMNFMYASGPDGFPDVRLGNCDCSGDGKINLADYTRLVDHVYISKDPLPLPCFDWEYPNQ